MERRDTNQPSGELLRLLSDFALSKNLSIGDASAIDQLLKEVAATLQAHSTDPIRLHGFRVQSMFAYLAAAMGNCQIISEEDAGIFFDSTGKLRQPDFRILTNDGLQFLVEVKNFHSSKTHYVLKTPYLQAIRSYAEALELPVKFAIYWSRWSVWTLVDEKNLTCTNGKAELLLTDALKLNEMSLIGDSSIGTVSPIAVRFHADASKPRTVSSSGETPFTVKAVSLHAAGVEIVDEFERKLGWFLLLHGRWPIARQVASVEGDQLNFVEFNSSPEEPIENQGFDIIGNMSQMISNQYLNATTIDNDLVSLAPKLDADKLGVLVPRDYDGKVLKLWRFHQSPAPR